MARGRTQRSFRQAARDLRRFARELDAVVPSGLRAIGEEIKTDVSNSRPGRGVPKDTGNLASTGRVSGGGKVARSGRLGSARVLISYGGPAAPYALRQHEDMTYRHTLGEARYLVRGVQRWQPNSSPAMAGMRAAARLAVLRTSRTSVARRTGGL